MHINDLLKIAVERKASDLHLKVGAHPVIRVDGDLIPLVDLKRLMQEDTIAMAFSIMSSRQKEKFKNNFDIDIAYSVPGLGRFRCNIFQQRGTVGMVCRVIPARILTVREQLWMFSQFYGLGSREGWRRVDELLDAVGLGDQRLQRVSTLSTGPVSYTHLTLPTILRV